LRGGYGDTFEALFYLRVGHDFQIKESFKDFKDNLKIKESFKDFKNSRIKKELQRLQRLSNKKRVSKTSNKGSQIKESFKDFKGVCC